MNHACVTTFAAGVNPFRGLGAMPTINPEPIMQKPAKPAKTKDKPKDADYSTPYKPPVEVLVPDDMIDLGLTITNDPLPSQRAAPIYKYHPTFDSMKIGQSLRVPTANVGKVAGAMRKWIGMKGKTAHLKSTPRYVDPKTLIEDVGFGRVWLLAGVSKTPSRKKA